MIPRIALLVAGLAALALPLPGNVAGVAPALAGLIALGLSAARPGSTAPAVLIAASVLSWLSTPDGHQHGLRLAALALALAVVHSSAALAAVVPLRAHVPPGLLLRWAGWTAAAAVAGGSAVGALTLLPAPGAPVWPTVVAVLAVGGLAVVGAIFVGRASGGPRRAREHP